MGIVDKVAGAMDNNEGRIVKCKVLGTMKTEDGETTVKAQEIATGETFYPVYIPKSNFNMKTSFIMPQEGDIIYVNVRLCRHSYIVAGLNESVPEDENDPITTFEQIGEFSSEIREKKMEISFGEMKVVFDLENNKFSIKLSDENNQFMIEKGAGITVAGEKEIIEKTTGGTVKFTGDTFDAGTGNINIKGSNINVNATQKAVLNGVNVEAGGSASTKISGASIDIKGDAMATLSAGLVKIG